MKEIGIGIIGIGNMGWAHAECIAGGEIEGMYLAAVCDINQEKTKKFCASHKDVAAYTDYSALMEDANVSAVLIAVPHPLHAEIAIHALDKGLHVLLEKPADIAVSKVRELNEKAEKSDKVFGMMFNQRTNPLFKKAREIVRSGMLGQLKRSVWIITNWYRTQSYYDSGDWRATWKGEGGGVLLNQAPHNLDLWQWICGMPTSVTAFCDTAKYHNIEVEDDVTILARYKNGATGTFITSTGEYPGTNRLEISGEKGKIVLENGVLKWWQLKSSEREVCFTSSEGFAQIDYEYIEINQESPETAHKGICQNFANAILNGDDLLAPGSDGIYELMISNAAYLSEWKGNVSINIPFDEAEFDELLKIKAEHSVHTIKTSKEGEKNKGYKTRWQVNW